MLIDLTLEAQDARSVETFEQALGRAPEVVEPRRLSGGPDYFARVAVADLAADETFPSRHVMTIPRIRSITSHFTMKHIEPAL
ncbi:Lrp/AsnC ligand binding domain-containing protein [Marinactinospora thermotolerans]|uniref:Transcriptional regulators n=1 Tax=Marinactinospora thermotolerans DSM 45154 TaxID=1122192 RepID=A0A1T4PQM5_9ACTN|nr:Lrp/AsnC ligand binding domain-containing protein [Marinactinospora thermotolerans]SJZ93860.1 Transcriptional regulators [Marinactinospora thermotolerans DSM 45154]